MLQVCYKDASLFQPMTTYATQQPLPQVILQVLDEFEYVFQEPTQLPLSRPSHDHQIPLIQGSNPVQKQPYRYTKQQNDIIENLIKECLKSGIIQHNTNPYASLVV